jgi:MFS family permease
MSRVISAAELRPASRAPLWWAAAALLFGAAFGTNVFTALLSLYRSHLHLSATDVNAIFGVYALGLAPSLLLGGPASDRYGRLRVLVPAVVLTGGASLIFLLGADSTALLYTARFVQGLASGAAFSVGSAWLQDLVGTAFAAAAARRASLALNAGFCLGPLTSGLLGQYGPAPLRLPFVVHAVLVAALLLLAAAVGGRAAWLTGRTGTPGSALLPRTGLAAAERRVFRRSLVPDAICVYAFPSVSVTVLPLLLAHQSHVVAFTGALAAVSLGAGAVVQPFAHRLGGYRGAIGAALGAAGYGLGAIATTAPSSALVFVGGALLGAGGGLCLNAGLTLVHELSTPATRGACNGLFYTWAYVGFAAPLLTTAFVSSHHLVRPLLVLTALSLGTALWLWRELRSPVEPLADADLER